MEGARVFYVGREEKETLPITTPLVRQAFKVWMLGGSRVLLLV
jgi:hypothetical protein